MSQLAAEDYGAPPTSQEVLAPIMEKVKQGREDRSRFEAVWHSNRAFAAGKHWLKTSRGDRRLVLDKRDVEGGKQRVTVDVLTQYLNTGLGQLTGVEERPQLLFRRDDLPAEDFAQVANGGLQYGWDSEWRAKRQLERIKRRLVVDGTAAIQCLFDPTVGRELGDVPVGDGYGIPIASFDPAAEPQQIPTRSGRPILDNQHAVAFVAHRQSLGQSVNFRTLREGRIIWKPRSVFNIVVPPALEDEDEFTWEAIISAASIESLMLRYGQRAQGLIEEPLAALETIGVKDASNFGMGLGSDEEDYGSPGELKGHVALVQYFERPSTQHPKGRVVTYAKNRLLDVADELPYRKANGDWSSGIVYFTYWKVEGRFWGKALIEPGKGIQRTYNKRCQQEQLTIDRGQPYTLSEENSEVKKKTGAPLEIVTYRPGTTPPQTVAGIGPGPWIWESKQGLIEDLERALGIHGVSTGDEPSRQTTYAELALRAEKDKTKTGPITDRFQQGVRDLVEFSVWDMRRYWPAQKQIMLEGEAGEAEAVEFNAQRLPEAFLVKVAEGTKPRDQAAEIQLIFDVFQQALNIQQPLPISWLFDSVAAGKALPLPEIPSDVHADKAEWENSQMWDGNMVDPAEYDPPEIHIPIHREAQAQATMANRMDVVEILQRHLDETEQMAQALAAEAQQKLEAQQGGATPLPQTAVQAPPEPQASQPPQTSPS